MAKRPIRVPSRVGPPPIRPARPRNAQLGGRSAPAIGAAMPNPSVTLWSAKPTTRTLAKATAPVAADWPIARPSERLWRPRPEAIASESQRGEGAPCWWLKRRALK